MKKLICIGLLSVLALVNNTSLARHYPTPTDGSDIVGYTEVVYPLPGESFVDLSVKYEAGYEELKWANPDSNYWTPDPNMPIILPFEYIMPEKRSGIVSNIPEMRTYFFPKNEDVVYVYPVGVGRMDWKTPLGTSRITIKQEAPPWYPPESIRKEHVEMGKGVLPRVVPAGPDNPLGNHVLRLSIPSYLLHGTNDVTGIGMRVTHGCMRFFPQNIEELYRIVPTNTQVTFINEPIKIGWKGNQLMIEVHPPLEEDNLSTEDMLNKAHKQLEKYYNDPSINMFNMHIVDDIIREMNGMPTQIGDRNYGYSNQSSSQNSSSIDIDWDKFKKR